MADRSLRLIARGFIRVVGVLGIVFALNMSGIFDLILLAFAVFVSGAFVPTLAALFWKKATKTGAIVSSIVASGGCRHLPAAWSALHTLPVPATDFRICPQDP